MSLLYVNRLEKNISPRDTSLSRTGALELASLLELGTFTEGKKIT